MTGFGILLAAWLLHDLGANWLEAYRERTDVLAGKSPRET